MTKGYQPKKPTKPTKVSPTPQLASEPAPPIKDKSVMIVNISAIVTTPMGGFDVIGLGADGKVYKWDYNVGDWLKNWAV